MPEQVQPVGDVLSLEPGHVGLIAVEQHLEQQLVLRAEVMEDAGVRHPDLVGDVSERAVRKALAAEDLDGGIEDVAAAGGAIVSGRERG